MRSVWTAAAPSHQWQCGAVAEAFDVQDFNEAVYGGVEAARNVLDDVVELAAARHLVARGGQAALHRRLVVGAAVADALLDVVERRRRDEDEHGAGRELADRGGALHVGADVD